MKTLPVSQKVYADIMSRIADTFSDRETTLSEAVRLVDCYLADEQPVSDDLLAMVAFSMVKSEIDRAMIRSSRARMRARLRKMDSVKVAEADIALPKLSRRERRLKLQEANRAARRRWKPLSAPKRLSGEDERVDSAGINAHTACRPKALRMAT